MTHIKEILNRLIEVRNKTKEGHTRSALDLLICDIEDEITEIENLIEEANEMGFVHEDTLQLTLSSVMGAGYKYEPIFVFRK